MADSKLTTQQQRQGTADYFNKPDAFDNAISSVKNYFSSGSAKASQPLESRSIKDTVSEGIRSRRGLAEKMYDSKNK